MERYENNTGYDEGIQIEDTTSPCSGFAGTEDSVGPSVCAVDRTDGLPDVNDDLPGEVDVPDEANHPHIARWDAPTPPGETEPASILEDDAEWNDACFGVSVVEEILGPVEVPRREVRDDGTEVYDERREVVADVRRAVRDMRDKIMQAARAVGMDVTEEEVASWKPDRVGMAKLRKDLAPQRHRMNMVAGATAYIEDQRAEAAALGIRLRPHQLDAVTGYADFLAHAERTTPQGGKSGLIIQPTGSGKAREIVEIVEMVNHMSPPDKPNRTLVITPMHELQKQIVGADGRQGFGRFAPHRRVDRYDAVADPERKEEALQEAGTLAMCLPSFFKLVSEGKMPWFDKVVVDEVHKATGKYAVALEEYSRDKILVGCTATPDLDEQRSARSLCKHLIAEMHAPEGIQRGILAPAKAWLLDSRPVIEGRLSADPKERRAQLADAVMKGRMLKAVEIIKEELARGAAEIEGGIRVVVRCRPGQNVKDAYTFAKMLRGALYKGPNGPLDMRPVMAAFVGGDTERQSRAERDEALQLFREGKINVTSNVKLLELGFDLSRVKVWIDLAGGSKVPVTQGAGRALRLIADDNGNPVLGPNGKPIEAHLYGFAGSRFTVLDVLGVERSGQGVEHSTQPYAPIPKPRSFNPNRIRKPDPPPEVALRDVVTTIVGTVAVDSGVAFEPSGDSTPTEAQDTEQYTPSINPLAPSGYPNQSGLEEFTQAFGADMEMPPHEAARVLGVSMPTLRGMMLGKFGDLHHTPTVGDIKRILHENPLLQAPPVPDMGYTHIPPRDRAVRMFATKHGVRLSRFTDGDGIIRFYMSDKDLQRLLRIQIEQENQSQRHSRR